MSNYRRYYINGGTWFFTVNLKNRQTDLLISHVADLRTVVKDVKQKKPFYIDAWVVLPEHLHCIWTLPQNEYDFSARWREIKKRFSKAIKCGAVWQPRFWEHAIRDEEDYRRHVDYIYINPVKHGWVTRVQDWPFSSFHRDVREGIYPVGWAGDINEFNAGER
ncbi:transposase [Enterobacteriaceae bacterium strain FGI 57]|nr:transposase [Enterobacteriaceae bacterium strain FGI 57]